MKITTKKIQIICDSCHVIIADGDDQDTVKAVAQIKGARMYLSHGLSLASGAVRHQDEDKTMLIICLECQSDLAIPVNMSGGQVKKL